VRGPIVVAAALTSAVLLWAASPAGGAGWLAWIALVPVAAASLAAAGTRAGRAAVPLAYVAYLELTLVRALPFGIAEGQFGDPALPILVAGSPVLFAAFVGVPLFGALLYLVRFPELGLAGRGPAGAILVPALAWTALDVLRTKLDPSGLWGPLFLGQEKTAAAILASLAGPWLLTFAIVAVGYAIAFALVRRRRAPAVAAVCALSAAGLAAESLHPEPDTARSLRVGAVQPGWDTSEFERPVLRHLRASSRNDERATLDLAGDLGEAAVELGRAGAALVVWPEATAWVDPAVNELARAALAGVAADAGALLVVPHFVRAERRGGGRAISADGSVSGSQPKQRPMWFLDERGHPGRGPRPLEAGGPRLGLLLGVDNQDPGVARGLVSAGADVLVSATHDWRELAPQQRAFARLHAVALGVPVVRADWRYGSFVVDARGRILADAGAERVEAAPAAEVAPRAGLTLYARLGDALAWAAVVAAAAAGLAGLVRRRASAG
jgi:apolipoprotein N-acyltransferase